MLVDFVNQRLLVVVFLMLLLGACNRVGGSSSAKYSAEELGYATHFSNVGVGNYCTALVENGYDQDKYRALHDARKLSTAQAAYGNHMKALRNIYAQHMTRLQLAAPPDAFRELHATRLAFLVFTQLAVDNATQSVAQQFFQQCKNYLDVADRVLKAIDARTVSHATKGTLILSYQPPLVPSLSLHPDGTFTVKSSIATPIGNFSLGYKNTTGAKLLIIRSEGRERYFTLDRPFELFIPATHGVRVLGDGKTTLTIEVVQR